MGKRVLAGVDLEPVSLSSRNSEELPISSSGSSDATFTSASEITISSKENGGPKTGDLKFVTDGNGKGAAGKGDSDGVGNGAGQGKVKDGGTKSWTLSLDRTGVWFDTDGDGIRDGGETSATLTAVAGGLSTVNGVDMAADNVTLRIVDFNVATPLDLTGFGAGDKLIFDAKTNKNDWFGFGGSAYWNLSSRPGRPANALAFTDNPGGYSQKASAFIFSTGLKARLGANTFVFASHRVNPYTSKGKIWGYFVKNNQAANLSKFSAPLSALAPNEYFSTSRLVGSNLGAGYALEFVAPTA